MALSDLVPVLTAVLGASAALTGVFLKSVYDRRAERIKVAREDSALFLDERREAYDRFLTLHRTEKQRAEGLRKYVLIVRDGGADPSADELTSFPESVMSDLSDALDTIRRLARSYAVVQAAENIMRLYADLAAAQRKLLDAVTRDGGRSDLANDAKQHDDVLWFVLINLQRDRELEFIHAYRQDLGIGHPAGGPDRFPIEERERPFSQEESERIIRHHLIPRHPLGQCAQGATSATKPMRRGPSHGGAV